MHSETAIALCRDDPRPILIAGPTASGKSALALAIAEAVGGQIVNADALQVYARWRILTARPGPTDLHRVPHLLYGHVAGHGGYSVGRWLAEIEPLLAHVRCPVIVGGTGLYFSALTAGLAHVPDTPAGVRREADARVSADGAASLLPEIDPPTRARIDTANPARIQRAWEVLQATGQGLAEWQDRTGPPILAPGSAHRFVLQAPPEVLGPRIARRFDAMLREGALDEVRANAGDFDVSRPADRAIGAVQLVDHLEGRTGLAEARRDVIVATRQYAKRQRTWFRGRMRDWMAVEIA